MPRNYDAVDLLWSTRGDFFLDPSKDLGDTSFDSLLAVAQDMYCRCKTDLGDFQTAPLVGASISDFVGEPNNAVNGNRLRDRLFNSMTSYGVIAPGDVSVSTFPTSPTSIGGIIRLRILPTALNKYSTFRQVEISYDYRENHVVGRLK